MWFDPEMTPLKDTLFQTAVNGTVSDGVTLLSLSFADGHEHESDEDESDQGVWIHDVNEEDSDGDSPLLVACRSGNLEIVVMIVVPDSGVSSANKLADTPLLTTVGSGKVELAEMLVSKGSNVKTVREDGVGLLSLDIVSQQPEILKFALSHDPDMLPHQVSMSECDFTKACVESYFDPVRIDTYLRTGVSPLGMTGQVGDLMVCRVLESSTRNSMEDVCVFLFHNLDILQDPSKWPVKHVVRQLASREVDTVFGVYIGSSQ